MDGWTDGCWDGWMGGWMDAWMDVYVYACACVYVHKDVKMWFYGYHSVIGRDVSACVYIYCICVYICIYIFCNMCIYIYNVSLYIHTYVDGEVWTLDKTNLSDNAEKPKKCA